MVLGNEEIIKNKLEACIICGAIGDAWGSSFENEKPLYSDSTFFYLGEKPQKQRQWAITDDTQLTLITCEALCSEKDFSAQLLATHFVDSFRQKKLTGVGASTLKALQDLEAGIHWSQAGRGGEYAAGNGAAMRIAPLAFFKFISKETVRDVCRITHRNDEAYTAALAVFLTIRMILNGEGADEQGLLDKLILQLPDTNVRDRLMIMRKAAYFSISDMAKIVNSGYAVDSIPFAIYSAMQVSKLGLTEMFRQIINCGGDTDTNASIAGQIAGTLLVNEIVPIELTNKLKEIKGYDWIKTTISRIQQLV